MASGRTVLLADQIVIYQSLKSSDAPNASRIRKLHFQCVYLWDCLHITAQEMNCPLLMVFFCVVHNYSHTYCQFLGIFKKEMN